MEDTFVCQYCGQEFEDYGVGVDICSVCWELENQDGN